MAKLFNKKLMKQDFEVTDWKEATKIGVDMLVKEGLATPKLADAIFESTEKLGAYYVFEKGIALLHAPPGDYSIKAGASILLTKENIQFNNEDKWARVLVTLSSPDAESHMQIIQDFGAVFMDHDLKGKVLNSKSIEELAELIKNI